VAPERAKPLYLAGREGVGARVAVSEASPYAVEHADELRRNRSQGRPAAIEVAKQRGSGGEQPQVSGEKGRRRNDARAACASS